MKLPKVGDVVYFPQEDQFYQKSYGILKNDIGVVISIYSELFGEIFMQRINRKIDILLDHVETLWEI